MKNLRGQGVLQLYKSPPKLKRNRNLSPLAPPPAPLAAPPPPALLAAPQRAPVHYSRGPITPPRRLPGCVCVSACTNMFLCTTRNEAQGARKRVTPNRSVSPRSVSSTKRPLIAFLGKGAQAVFQTALAKSNQIKSNQIKTKQPITPPHRLPGCKCAVACTNVFLCVTGNQPRDRR